MKYSAFSPGSLQITILMICLSVLASEQVVGQKISIYNLLNHTDLDSACNAQEDNLRRCVTLDASESIDPGNPTLQFEWVTSDGQTLKGVKPDYCFDEGGWKEVALNVVDPVTGTRDDRDTVVSFYCSSKATFEVSEKRVVGRRIYFSLRPNACRRKDIKSEDIIYQWDLGGKGEFKEGKKTSTFFTSAGSYRIRLFEIATTPAGYVLLSASAQDIEIK